MIPPQAQRPRPAVLQFGASHQRPAPIDRFWSVQAHQWDKPVEILCRMPTTSPAFVQKTTEMLKYVPAFLIRFLEQFNQGIVLTPMLEDVTDYYSKAKEQARIVNGEKPLGASACFLYSSSDIVLPQFARVWAIEKGQPTYTILDQTDDPLGKKLQTFVHEVGHAVENVFQKKGKRLGLSSADFRRGLSRAFALDKALFKLKPHPYQYAMTNKGEALAEVFSACVVDRVTPPGEDSLIELTEARKYLPNMYRFVITEVLPRILPHRGPQLKKPG